MLPDSTVEVVWIGPVHNRGHGCGSLGKGCNKNRGEMISVCIGVNFCLLATGCFGV